jgi:hypothetical protein
VLRLQKIHKSSTLIISRITGFSPVSDSGMNIFKNKYFLLGNLAFLLLVIPIALYFIKNQISTRGSAAPTTTLSFNPPSIAADQCDNTQKTKLIVNPGQNIVSRVQLALKWDKTKFDIDIAPASSKFQVTKGPDSTPDGMNITIGIGTAGAESVNAISTTTELAVITIKPIAPSNGVIRLDIDSGETKVYSLSTQDGASENVYNAGNSSGLQLSITPKTCDTNNPSPTVTTTVSPSSSPSPSVTASVSPTAIPTQPTNNNPVCINLSTSTSSGSAPLSVTLTATGSDTDGTISKATFNFGDGASQDVSEGLGTASVSAQLAHTYNSGGNFTATSVFTDNSGAVSSVCSQPIAVAGAVATIAPTATPTLAPIATSIPTNTPTIAPSGSIGQTVGIIGGILVAIIAGVFLLAL